jgi:hypothetical protein
MDQFNIEGGAFEVMKGCCCPCAVFQQFLFTREIRKKKLNAYSNSTLDQKLIRDSEYSQISACHSETSSIDSVS